MDLRNIAHDQAAIYCVMQYIRPEDLWHYRLSCKKFYEMVDSHYSIFRIKTADGFQYHQDVAGKMNIIKFGDGRILVILSNKHKVIEYRRKRWKYRLIGEFSYENPTELFERNKDIAFGSSRGTTNNLILRLNNRACCIISMNTVSDEYYTKICWLNTRITEITIIDVDGTESAITFRDLIENDNRFIVINDTHVLYVYKDCKQYEHTALWKKLI